MKFQKQGGHVVDFLFTQMCIRDRVWSPLGSLEARRFFRCVVCSVRTAARFTERERVPMRTILCPDMCGKVTATVNSNIAAHIVN